MLSSVLLENYIKSYLLKEQISQSDHELIVEKMEEFNDKLTGIDSSMSLDTLDFNPKIVIALRDRKTLRDLGQERTKPDSVMQKAKSKSLKDFKFKKLKFVNDMPGLGFNPIDKLSSKKSFYVEKIEELISVYEEKNSKEFEETVAFLKNCLKLKKALEDTGLKLLGAGVYRFVVAIPELDDFVIKVGLSDKGRRDCSQEIDFSDGRSSSRLSHKENFPVIYTRSENKSWYAIEKAVFFSDKLFTAQASPEDSVKRREIKDDIGDQFSHTMSFLRAILREYKLKQVSDSYNTAWKLFKVYLYVLFDKSDSSFKDAHEEYIDFKKSFPSTNFQKPAETIISNSIFRQKLEKLLQKVSKTVFASMFNNPIQVDLDQAEINVTNAFFNSRSLNKMISEIGSMFDQAVVTNIRDLHTGNMGFKRNNEGKWSLVFTDIDSKS